MKLRAKFANVNVPQKLIIYTSNIRGRFHIKLVHFWKQKYIVFLSKRADLMRNRTCVFLGPKDSLTCLILESDFALS